MPRSPNITSQHKSLLKEDAAISLPTPFGVFTMHLYVDPCDGKEHLALIKGDVEGCENVLTRVHSECLTGDIFGSRRCDCGPQLEHGLKNLGECEQGILIYLRQEGRGIGLLEKMKAYSLQDRGYDTVQANTMLGHGPDDRDYKRAAMIIKSLKIRSIKLITNNPKKVSGLEEYGIQIAERISSPLSISKENRRYLKTKAEKLSHIFESEFI